MDEYFMSLSGLNGTSGLAIKAGMVPALCVEANKPKFAGIVGRFLESTAHAAFGFPSISWSFLDD